MMERSRGMQQKMLCVTLENLMPEKHFLRDMDRLVDFDFIYDRVESMYSHTGRRSIDPVVIIKMMLLGYLYGIDSERRLEQEVLVNIAFRWFLGIDLDEPVPDHSTLSQLRRRKFNGTSLFEEIFTEIVLLCMKHGLITGRLLLTDSTHVRANARNNLYDTVTVVDEPSAYIKRLNERAVQEGVLDENYEERMTVKHKEIKVSQTDPDSGYMHRPGKPNGFYYLSHQTCDSEHGLITDVFVTPGNVNDRTVHSERIQYQLDKYGFETEVISADKGYDSSEIHADMLERGIQTYIPRQKINTAEGRFKPSDYTYDEVTDTYRCPGGQTIPFSIYNPKLGGKNYRSKEKGCRDCPHRAKCISEKAKYKQIFRTLNQSAYEIQCSKNRTPEYYAALRLRQIWCEGNFAHQKENHNLGRMRKRGLGKAFEHCLLSATAFNLKRMVNLLRRSPSQKIIAMSLPADTHSEGVYIIFFCFFRIPRQKIRKIPSLSTAPK